MTVTSNTQKGKEASGQARWVVIAAFFGQSGSVWLDDFIGDPSLDFVKVPPGRQVANWHHQKGTKTAFKTWMGHLAQARAAMAKSPDGIIACLPQLAMCTALLKRLGFRKPKIIAYNFGENLSGFPTGFRQRAARLAASSIDLFVVHSPREVRPCAAYLGVPEERVRFVPLQRGNPNVRRKEDNRSPFVLSIGSSGRDYETLIKAVDALKIRTVIVTRPSAIDSLPKNAHVEFLSELSERECLELLAQARMLVTPISNLTTASGQATFINALRLGVPTVTTNCPGTDGYIVNGVTGILVEPFDEIDLRSAMDRLWRDKAARDALAAAGLTDSTERMSDEAAARALHGMIGELSGVAPAGGEAMA